MKKITFLFLTLAAISTTNAQEKKEKIGEKIGQERGEKTGRKALSVLLQKLMQEGRKEDVDRVLQDDEYQEQLLREYHLK